MNIRRIARTLGVNHQSVVNWVNAHAAQLPAAPVSSQVATLELDELFTFVEKKSRHT
jgi:transposase-like protein